MHYTTDYLSPLGKLVLTADEKGLTGLWFEAGNYFAPKEPPAAFGSPDVSAPRAALIPSSSELI